MSDGALRVLTTNDFIGSFFPQRTSYGQLPGAAGLSRAIETLRDGHDATLWIDTGDLFQGSALGPLTGGTWAFIAARTLGIDVGTVGNHELDWGLEHLQRWARELPFPLLAANADFGFAPSTIVQAGAHRVGVIGISYPQMAFLHPDRPTRQDIATIVKHHASRLRSEAADFVVLALHDGVDLGLAAEDRAPVDPQRIEGVCGSLDGSVDLVLGGHTLGSYQGELGGVAYLQPWPFGSQVGVADLSGGEVALATVDVSTIEPYDGPGAAVHAQLEQQIVGINPSALRSAPGRDASLIQAIADGLLTCDDDVDMTVIGPRDLWNQAPRDGTYAYLPEGPVSMAQVLRLTPASGARSAWGGQLVTAKVSCSDVDRIVEAFAAARYAPGGDQPAGAPAIAQRSTTKPRQRIAVPPFYAARIHDALGQTFAWSPTTTTWRDALLSLPWIDPNARP